MRFGTLEAGGTKMVLSVGNEDNELLEQETLPTESPDKTIPAMAAWFRAREIVSLGIGTFGPVDLNPESKTYGWITSTPKPGWRDQPLLPLLRDALSVPVKIDTDVNAAALAEWKLGAARGLNSCLYVTVGTGVGAGLIVEGRMVHGLMHPELGHMLLRPEAAVLFLGAGWLFALDPLLAGLEALVRLPSALRLCVLPGLLRPWDRAFG